jgi:hypothetical protein
MPRTIDRPVAVAEICDEIAAGASLRAACSKQGRPTMTTFLRWVIEDGAICEQYAHAREAQASFYADEMVEIVDTEIDPARARVRMDARKWVASKLAPKKYGDRVTQEHVGGDGGPLVVTWGGPAPKAAGDE